MAYSEKHYCPLCRERTTFIYQNGRRFCSKCGYQELGPGEWLEQNEGVGREKVEMQTTRGRILKLLSAYPDMTYREIGEIVGCTRQRVHQVARKAGLTGGKKSRLYREDVTIERVLDLYYCSTGDIARMLGCNENTIRRRLRAAGIRPSEGYSRRSKLYWRGPREAAGVARR